MLLAVPATNDYLGVLRTATAGLAARLQFTLDEIEDLRIAVDEACALLVAVAADESELACRFTVTGDVLIIEVTVQAAENHPQLPSGESFAWQVLGALADDVTRRVSEGEAAIRLVKSRPAGTELAYSTD